MAEILPIEPSAAVSSLNLQTRISPATATADLVNVLTPEEEE